MSREMIYVILLMTAVTYGARVVPFIVFRNTKMSSLLKAFIELVPVALLAALVIPEFFLSQANSLSWVNPYLFAGICTFIFAKKVPNLFLSVLFGMIVFWGLEQLI